MAFCWKAADTGEMLLIAIKMKHTAMEITGMRMVMLRLVLSVVAPWLALALALALALVRVVSHRFNGVVGAFVDSSVPVFILY